MLVRFIVVCDFAIKRMLVFQFFKGKVCVFGGVRAGGRFNMIVFPELGSFTSKKHTRMKNYGKLESLLGKIGMFVVSYALLFLL